MADLRGTPGGGDSPPRELAPPPAWNPGSAPVSGITLGNAISISVGKMVVFYLFCIKLDELVELDEFN